MPHLVVFYCFETLFQITILLILLGSSQVFHELGLQFQPEFYLLPRIRLDGLISHSEFGQETIPC